MNARLLAKMMSKSKTSHKVQNKVNLSVNLEQPGILLKGWFKYIMITPSKTSQDFEINPEYAHYNEVMPAEEKQKEDEVGKLDIPDEQSFFMVMTGTTINILSSRRNMITKTIDVIDLNVTDKIKMDMDGDGNLVYTGGLKSMGVFDEGRCFQLTLKVGFKYIICSSDYKKEKLMEENIYRFYDAKMLEIKDPFKGEMTAARNFTIDMEKFDLPKYIKEQNKPFKEGEIEDLGDWSICDQVCGGGSQMKWRGCKPPMPVGPSHSCKRKPMKLERACNTQPCKGGQKASKIPVMDMSWKALQPTITLPAHLDARFVSHRYQEYEECKIKDEDLCIRRADLKQTLDMEEAPILPGRGILNRKTFSFYENSKYDSLQRSYLLEDIETNPFPHDSNCFEVKSKNEVSDVLVLCGCPFTPGAGTVATNWMQEINKFRFSCGVYFDGAVPITDKDKIQMSIGNEEVEIDPEQVKAMAKEAAQEKEKDAAQLAEEAEARKMDAALNGMEEIAADATNNEFFKEQLLQKENQLKQRKDLEKMDKAIQKAEEKLKCMETMIEREKQKAAKKNKEVERKEEIKEIKKEVESEVKAVKKTFHNKMDSFTRETERLKAKKMQKLTELRQRMTKILIDQGARGSRSNCLVDKEEQKIGQCNAKFTTNWFENKYCREKENFCGVCCDKEFAVTYPEDREKCIYECRLKNGQVMSSGDKLSESNYVASVETITNA